jgi:Flp pilus assembly pilin Flp
MSVIEWPRPGEIEVPPEARLQAGDRPHTLVTGALAVPPAREEIYMLRTSRRASLKSPWADETGATSVEYALLASMIAGVIIAIVTTIGTQTIGLFDRLASSWPAP